VFGLLAALRSRGELRGDELARTLRAQPGQRSMQQQR
jgi:hypothetical protein